MTFQALLFCPDEKTSRVTTQILTELEFTVEAATEPFAAVKKLMGQHFDAVVVDCNNEQNASLILKSARNSNSNQSSLAVAVVEGQAGVANAFRIGANLVLTKPVNLEQAKSTLRVARGLLRKGVDSAKSSAPMPSTASAPSTQFPPNPARAGVSSPSLTREPVLRPSATKPAPLPIESRTEPFTAPKSPLDFEDPLGLEADSASDPRVAGTMLFASTEQLKVSGATQPAVDKTRTDGPSARKENSPQPVAKTSSAMAPSQGPAGEPASPSASGPSTTITRKPTSAVALNAVKPLTLVTSSAAGPGGAATAPARAHVQPKSKISDPQPPIAPLAGTMESPASTLASAASSGDTAAIPVEPALATFEPKPSESTSKGGGKTVILTALAVVVLAVAGYFAYIKVYAPRQGASKPVAPAVPQTPAPTAPAPTASAAPTSEAMGTASTAPQSQAPVQSLPTAANSTPEEPEVVVKSVPAKKPIVVKSTAPAHKSPAAANAEVAAPPLLGSTPVSEPNLLSHMVSTPPVAAPKMAPQTLRVSQGVTQGLLIKRVQPTYPRQALQLHIQGVVQLQATISKEGMISGTKIVSGDPLLAHAAIDAVKQWRYKPYFLNGEPVEIETQITMNFKLP